MSGISDHDVPALTDAASPPRRLVGRGSLLASVEAQLASGGSVLLTGPSGIGKSVLAETTAAAAVRRGEHVLRINAVETDRWIPYAGLADLLTQIPAEYLAELPEPQRAAIDSVLSGRGVDEARLARRLAWLALLQRCAQRRPVLIFIDDVQWLDKESVDVMAYAARRVDAHRVRTVIAERWPDSATGHPDRGPAGRRGSAAGTRSAALATGALLEVEVPPLAADELADLLELYALPARAASKLHADSGGNPYLALALAGAFAERGAAAWRPAPLPPRLHALLRERVEALPADVRETLLFAALATYPTVDLLRRAGRTEAERQLHLAAAAGLLVTDGSVVRLTPPAVATVVAELATGQQRAAVHAVLAGAVSSAAERTRHRALASTDPNAEVARSLVTAGDEARLRGARGLAAELYLLAAERTPPELDSERVEWLVRAAEVGLTAGRPELVHRAVDEVLAADATRAQRVRARMALIDLAGQSVATMDETFAAAFADAEDDAALLGPLRLRLSWAALVDGRPARAETEADRAVELAGTVGDTVTEAMALTVKATVARIMGRSDYVQPLRRALALPQPAVDGWLHMTPRFMAVRFATFDDRLDYARTELLRILALVERGAGEETVAVLRSLSEVSARLGRCREALDYAQRAIRITQEAGLSPGPAWYNCAVAELAGGSIERAKSYAERGLRASEQEGDSIYLGRNLHALGQALLRCGDARTAVEAFRRLVAHERAQGVGEPAALRWHSDFALALAALDELDEAELVIRGAREAIAGRAHANGVAAQLDRAQAVLRTRRGDAGTAIALLEQAIREFERLGQPVEQGHCLLILGQAERRRRHYAAAREAVREALATFARIDAKPWVEEAERNLRKAVGAPAPTAAASSHRTPAQSIGEAVVGALTPAESRIAAMVVEGASNREVASRMFLSIKTVEATLTRIYRKLGVRSRTQLTSRLRAE
ncbi:MAG TPA: LuxR family transcriptional regulator [Micromonosporaceae bacterium]